MSQEIFLSLGSNVGDRRENLRRAVAMLRAEVDLTAVSSIWSTKPVGVTNQPDFLNIAVAARTDLEPFELLGTVKRIEQNVGRVRTYRWGPRVIDVDIVLYGDLVLEAETLTIPHSEMRNRAFVLAPLAEIAPGVADPRSGIAVSQLLDVLPDRHEVRIAGVLDPDE